MKPKIYPAATRLFAVLSMIFILTASAAAIRAQSAAVENNLFSISESPESPLFDSTKFCFESLAVVDVTNTEELYATANNSANAGSKIVERAARLTINTSV